MPCIFYEYLCSFLYNLKLSVVSCYYETHRFGKQLCRMHLTTSSALWSRRCLVSVLWRLTHRCVRKVAKACLRWSVHPVQRHLHRYRFSPHCFHNKRTHSLPTGSFLSYLFDCFTLLSPQAPSDTALHPLPGWNQGRARSPSGNSRSPSHYRRSCGTNVRGNTGHPYWRDRSRQPL